MSLLILFVNIDTDQFRSEPAHSGKITWTMSDLNEVGSQANLPTDWYNNYHALTFTASITHGDMNLQCSGGTDC